VETRVFCVQSVYHSFLAAPWFVCLYGNADSIAGVSHGSALLGSVVVIAQVSLGRMGLMDLQPPPPSLVSKVVFPGLSGLVKRNICQPGARTIMLSRVYMLSHLISVDLQHGGLNLFVPPTLT